MHLWLELFSIEQYPQKIKARLGKHIKKRCSLEKGINLNPEIVSLLVVLLGPVRAEASAEAGAEGFSARGCFSLAPLHIGSKSY